MFRIIYLTFIASVLTLPFNLALAQNDFMLCGHRTNVNKTLQNCLVTENAHQYNTLKDMKKLEKLEMSSTRGYQFDDVGAGYVKEATNLSTTLKRLTISRNVLSDEGFKGFSHLQALEEFHLFKPQDLTDASLETVGQMKSLKIFKISEPKNIDGSGLVHLANLQNLKQLKLYKVTGLTIENLRPLTALKPLKILDIRKSNENITKDDLDFLLAANPNLKIMTDY